MHSAHFTPSPKLLTVPICTSSLQILLAALSIASVKVRWLVLLGHYVETRPNAPEPPKLLSHRPLLYRLGASHCRIQPTRKRSQFFSTESFAVAIPKLTRIPGHVPHRLGQVSMRHAPPSDALLTCYADHPDVCPSTVSLSACRSALMLLRSDAETLHACLSTTEVSARVDIMSQITDEPFPNSSGASR